MKVQAWLGYHIWTLRIHNKDSQILFFLHFSHGMFYISCFFNVKWNNFVSKNLYASKISIVFTYESENSKILSNMGHVLLMAQNILTFWNFLHYNKAFGSYHIHTFYTHLTHKVFVEKILGQKNLFRHSLQVFELFFFMKQSPRFFSRTW
jgi:hypothetical protein